MELLTLPEPAASLWRRASRALERALAQSERPPARWSIGGGTILAQRWGHRESTDIDLTVSAGTGIDRLDERVGGTLKADMTAAGAADVSTGRTRHRIVFEQGSIDIAELDARPAAGEVTAVIEGSEVSVKTTTQILRGKLERAMREESPARDLFDIAVAHHADPDALAQAANMLGEDEIRQVKTHWRINAHRLEHEAKATLAKASPEYEPERRDLVARAAARLEDARYQAVRIRAAQSGLTIETRTAGRRPTTIRTGHDKTADTLERTGIGEFLNRHTAGGRRRVTEDADAARARGGTETTILDWQRPPVVQVGDHVQIGDQAREPAKAPRPAADDGGGGNDRNDTRHRR